MEDDKKGIMIIAVVALITMSIVCSIALCTMYKQSKHTQEQMIDAVRIYFETDYDYVDYPNIVNQQIGGN